MSNGWIASTCGSGTAGLDAENAELTLINTTITGNQGYSDGDAPGLKASNF